MGQNKRHYDLEREPNYRLEFNEPRFVRPPLKWWMILLKIGMATLIVLSLLLSLIVGELVFWDIPWDYKFAWLFIIISVFSLGEKPVLIPISTELQFFDKYFVIYRPIKHYGRTARREYDIIEYEAVKKVTYSDARSGIMIYCGVYEISYPIDKKGRCSTTPKYERYVKEDVRLINKGIADGIDFKREIEEHSPIKVEVLPY